ncbi:TrkH family potassium uptake protein [Desulfoplanes sp. PS50]
MRWGQTLHLVGVILVFVGLSMLLPLVFSLFYRDGGIFPLAIGCATTLLVGTGLIVGLRSGSPRALNHREGMAVVALGWAAAGLFGAIPFCLGGIDCFTDAVFESFSGFTTTGASILTDIEALPRGLLMWRSLTHWLGGMGIIVLSLAILPFLGVGGMQLYRAEVPGPIPDKLRPRIKDTAVTLWKVYVLFTLVEALLLMFGGMDFFDAVCHSFGTLATGGFSTKNASIAWYDSAYIDGVITFFMFMAGINFALHFNLLRGKPLFLLKDPEFRFFALLTALLVAVCTVVNFGSVYSSLATSFRYSAFQVISILTTTGYGTSDYELWLPLPQLLLLFSMFVGGCAGSTSGGMKCMRIMLLFKQGYRELFRLIHPRGVRNVKIGERLVKPEVLSGVWGFFVLFLGLLVISTLLVAATGVDVLTSISAVLACIGNIGPGLGSVGPTDNFAHIPVFGKWVLTLCMVLGRLEVYTVIVLFVPEFWKK